MGNISYKLRNLLGDSQGQGMRMTVRLTGSSLAPLRHNELPCLLHTMARSRHAVPPTHQGFDYTLPFALAEGEGLSYTLPFALAEHTSLPVPLGMVLA